MNHEIISLIKSNRDEGITWDDIQKNISTRFGEEYSISEIRKAFNSPVSILQAKSDDEIVNAPISFDDDPYLELQFEKPINQELNMIMSSANPELIILKEENERLKKTINDNSEKWKIELKNKLTEVITKKDSDIDKLMGDVLKLHAENQQNNAIINDYNEIIKELRTENGELTYNNSKMNTELEKLREFRDKYKNELKEFLRGFPAWTFIIMSASALLILIIYISTLFLATTVSSYLWVLSKIWNFFF